MARFTVGGDGPNHHVVLRRSLVKGYLGEAATLAGVGVYDASAASHSMIF
jgi:hypothetical protein